MMRWLLTRTLYEKRWFIVGWGLALGFMGFLIMMFYPSFSESGAFETVSKTLPEALKGFIGDPSVFSTLDGYVASQFFDVRMPLLLLIMTLVLAVGLTLREEEGGDMRTLLSGNMSRSRVVLEKYLAGVIIISLVNLAAVAGVYLGITSLAETAPHELIWKLYGLSVLFGSAAFAVPFSLALASGSRALTMSVGLIVAIGSYIVTTFAKAVDWLKDWDHISLMHYYDTNAMRLGEFDPLDAWVLSSVIVTMLIIAFIVYRRRDIA